MYCYASLLLHRAPDPGTASGAGFGAGVAPASVSAMAGWARRENDPKPDLHRLADCAVRWGCSTASTRGPIRAAQLKLRAARPLRQHCLWNTGWNTRGGPSMAGGGVG